MAYVGGRGHKPGQKKGGRKKGVPNKLTMQVIERLAELDCDPIEGMAIIAAEARAAGDLALAGQMYKELAHYVAPKRAAVSHSFDQNSPLNANITIQFID